MPHGGGFVRTSNVIKIERQVVVLGLMELIIMGFTQTNKYEVSYSSEANLFIFVGSSFCHILYQRQLHFLSSHH